MHICFDNLTIIGSDNGLLPGRHQAIIWTNAGILLSGPNGTNFSEILIEILTFSLKKMHFKASFGNRRPFCLGLNMLNKPYNMHVPVERVNSGRVTHICIGKQTIIGSDNGLSPGRRQAIIWTNAGILLIGPLGTHFSEISIKIRTFSFTKMHLKVWSVKWRPFCLILNVLIRMTKVSPRHWNFFILLAWPTHTHFSPPCTKD